MPKLVRLDKFLAEMGTGSRSQIKEAAKRGRIQVNGVVEKKTDRKIDLDQDHVFWDGTEIVFAEMEYYMLNKPQGVVSATVDNLHKTVLELLADKKRQDLFPAGRLDIDTEGLLLITNDGSLAHRLLSPRHHVDKTYFARVEGRLPDRAVELFLAGLVMKDGTKAMPAGLKVVKVLEDGSEILLTIQEGKFHQVKRMFEAVDCRVVYLKRISMGPLKLDEGLKPGEYRPLKEEEIKQLKDMG